MTTPIAKTCDKCGQTLDIADFYRYAASPDGYTKACKACYNAARGSRGSRAKAGPTEPSTVKSGRFVASRELLQINDVVLNSRDEDGHAMNVMFLGPSGCGKTEAARHLAEVAGLPFTKVDAASMTDPESWFGTREVIAEDGVPVTVYRPSIFVEAIQSPGYLLIDEVNRVRDEHRNILIPLLDGTHQVTNPLTGDIVAKHPDCIVVMSGNRGLQFTGTYAVDPALMTRSLVMEFSYLDAKNETAVAVERTGVDESIAALFVRFANETRQRTTTDPDMIPMSTREVISACRLVKGGAHPDLAAQVAVINLASDEGGVGSVRTRLLTIWGGIRKPNA